MPSKVAILGCGPAGLLAAHAAQANGCHFDVFSKRRPSYLFGAQYLHEPIPGVTGQPERVKYDLVGNPEDYRQKVYGASWDGSVSPEDLDTDHHAWDIRAAYRKLWAEYSDEIHHVEINDLRQIERDAALSRYDAVISTVPRTIWKQPGETFEYSSVWAIGDAPELGQFTPFSLKQDNLIVCDSTADVSWYRLSKVFGFSTIEWPGNKKPPVANIQEVRKPLKHNSTAASEFYHMGRYGKWEKGILTTDVYNEALKVTA